MALVQAASRSYEDTILRRHLPRWRPCRAPEAWAQYRLPLIKALPWYTSMEGGICHTVGDRSSSRYSATRYLTGLLISGYPGINSYMDAEIIITSLHNTVKVGKPTPETKRRIDAMNSTFADKRLLGCIIAQGATEDRSQPSQSSKSKPKSSKKKTYDKSATRPFFCCPVPKNQHAWVLGFYIITDHWKAQVDGGEVTMFRLERWKIQDKAWFASAHNTHNPPPLSARDFNTKATQEMCKTCGTPSPRMYEEYFLCRNEQCADYWKHNGEVSRDALTYTKSYLQQREPRPVQGGFKPYGAYQGTASFPEIAPGFVAWWQTAYAQLEQTGLTQANYQVRMKNLGKGFWCPSCGMLNARKHWEKWDCTNANCNFSRRGYPKISTPDELTNIYKTQIPAWAALPFFTGQEDADGYVKYNFDIGAGCGVACLIPKDGTNSMHQGADWMLTRLQNLASTGQVDLQKQFTMATSAGVLTNHYVHNYGRDYYLTVDIQQKTSFEHAPDVIRIAKDAASRLCRQYQQNPAANDEDFNESYLAAYFTENHMSWHADGEMGLGSVIAGWTLGGEGEMEIAPNDEQYWGQAAGRGKVIEDDPLLPGVLKRDERVELKFDLDNKLANINGQGTTQDLERKKARQEYEEEFKKVMKDDFKSNKETPRAILKLPLTHGSILVMHGKNFQSFFKHQVTVKGPLRFALTFRCITDEHSKLKPSKRIFGVYPHIPDTTYLQDFDDAKEDCEEQMDTQLAQESDGHGDKDGQQKGGISKKGSGKRPRDEDSEGEGEGKKVPKKSKANSAGCADPKGKGKSKKNSDDEDEDGPKKPKRPGLRSDTEKPEISALPIRGQKGKPSGGRGMKPYKKTT